MKENTFAEIVSSAQTNPESMMIVLNKMKPLIKSFAKKLFFLEFEDAIQELNISVIECVKKMPYSDNDGKCINYIHNSVKFKFLYLCRKHSLESDLTEHIELDDSSMVYNERYHDFEEYYDLEVRLKQLTSTQRKITFCLFCGFSDSETAKALGLSRQYVNRIKKSIFKKLYEKSEY